MKPLFAGKYLAAVKRLLPPFWSVRIAVLRELRGRVKAAVKDGGAASEAELCALIGAPEEVAKSAYSFKENAHLRKRVILLRIVFGAIVLIVVAALTVFLIGAFWPLPPNHTVIT